MRLYEIQQSLFQEPKQAYLGKYYVMINGKIWKRDGKPIEFDTQPLAQKSADTIMSRYQKATQVVPADYLARPKQRT